MKQQPRYLSKSRFKKARECPSKLFYLGKPDIYSDKSAGDSFLQSLAEGGYQVGELAKIYYPGGIEVKERRHLEAVEKTLKLLNDTNVSVIYEGAFTFQNYFVRADIIRKRGSKLDLIEVKAKSFDGSLGEDQFYTRPSKKKPKGISAGFKSYFEDVAFQQHVLALALPDWQVVPWLMLADNSRRATVDGLDTCFLPINENGRTGVRVKQGTTRETVGDEILTAIDASEAVRIVHGATYDDGRSFVELMEYFSQAYLADQFLPTPVNKECSKCEFRATPEEIAAGKKSGFHECWRMTPGFTEGMFAEPGILDLWSYRKKNERFGESLYLQRQLTQEHIGEIEENPEGLGLDQKTRQWKQIQMAKSAGGPGYYLDTEGMKAAFNTFVFPLHFIDFEASPVAIPFFKGLRPYETAVFQFSHHIVEEDATVRHATEWINVEPGVFPNFKFVRALKSALGNEGTIFRYAAYENTKLNEIFDQLMASNEPDRFELCEWIKCVTKPTEKHEGMWVAGPRNMVDLQKLVLKFYISRLMKGSNSIKKVLPAILNDSPFLKDKYSQAVYGTPTCPSANFVNQIWVTKDEATGFVADPYAMLPGVHEGAATLDVDLLFGDEDAEVADGGAALTAYARMQFTEMSAEERERLRKSLLAYCELDTLAMVMLYEGFREFCR